MKNGRQLSCMLRRTSLPWMAACWLLFKLLSDEGKVEMILRRHSSPEQRAAYPQGPRHKRDAGILAAPAPQTLSLKL